MTDPIGCEQIQQLLGRSDGAPIEVEQQVAYLQTGHFRGTLWSQGDNQEGAVAIVDSLRTGQVDGVARQAEVAALNGSVLEERRRRLPRDPYGDDDPKATDLRRCRHSDELAVRIDECPA